MNFVFADTFYWIALASTQDNLHDRAFEFSNFINPDKIVTTEGVLTEYLAFFAESILRVKASNTVAKLMKSNRVKVVPQTLEAFLDGLELYAARPDKGYSLIDCISMQTMRREGLTDVLTNDRHFEQEGFKAIFRDS